jgi:hypothetical protein
VDDFDSSFWGRERLAGSGIMSVRSVQPGGTLLFEIALAIFGIVGIGLPLALVIILVCR